MSPSGEQSDPTVVTKINKAGLEAAASRGWGVKQKMEACISCRSFEVRPSS